jgi:hypothetical protein
VVVFFSNEFIKGYDAKAEAENLCQQLNKGD